MVGSSTGRLAMVVFFNGGMGVQSAGEQMAVLLGSWTWSMNKGAATLSVWRVCHSRGHSNVASMGISQ
jgi:hypothetical protein